MFWKKVLFDKIIGGIDFNWIGRMLSVTDEWFLLTDSHEMPL